MTSQGVANNKCFACLTLIVLTAIDRRRERKRNEYLPLKTPKRSAFTMFGLRCRNRGCMRHIDSPFGDSLSIQKRALAIEAEFPRITVSGGIRPTR